MVTWLPLICLWLPEVTHRLPMHTDLLLLSFNKWLHVCILDSWLPGYPFFVFGYRRVTDGSSHKYMLIQRCTSYKGLKKGLQVLEYQEQVPVSAPAGLLRSRATYDNRSNQGNQVTIDE